MIRSTIHTVEVHVEGRLFERRLEKEEIPDSKNISESLSSVNKIDE